MGPAAAVAPVLNTQGGAQSLRLRLHDCKIVFYEPFYSVNMWNTVQSLIGKVTVEWNHCEGLYPADSFIMAPHHKSTFDNQMEKKVGTRAIGVFDKLPKLPTHSNLKSRDESVVCPRFPLLDWRSNQQDSRYEGTTAVLRPLPIG